MRRFLKILITLSLISSSFSLGAGYPTLSTGPLESDQNSIPNDENWLSAEGLEKAIANPGAIQDPFHLIQQDLVSNGQVTALYSLGNSPLATLFDKLDYSIQGDDFSIIGTHRGVETVRHTFRNLKIHSFIQDNEVLFGATKEGELLAIDMVFLKKNAFRGPIPVYKNIVQHDSFREPLKMNFWTRGLSPHLAPNLENDPNAIAPHDRSGKLFFSAGDLFLYRTIDGKSETFAILSRQVLAQHIEEKAEELTVRASLTSTEIFERMDPSALAKIESQMTMNVSADDLAQMAMRSISPESIQRLISNAEQLANENRLYDKASLDEWKGSYSIMMKEALKNEKQIQPGTDLSEDWQALMSSAMNKGKPLMQKPGFFKKYGLTLAMLTGTIVGMGTAYWVDFQPVMAALDYIYAHAVPPILKVAEYRYPLMASVVSLISIIPLVQSVAWMAPAAMQTVSRGLRAVSTNISDKLSVMAQQWRNLNIWQRLVTTGARVYSVISVSLWNHLGTLLRQPQLFRTLKMGLNPFEKVKTNSELGEALKLEKDLTLGVNNPFLGKDKLDSNSLKQQKAAQYIAQDSLRARHVAFQLVALTLYQKQEVDPATLAMLMEHERGTEYIDASLFKDLTGPKQKEWLALTEVIANDWLQTIRSEGRLFANIPAEDFLVLYESAREKLSHYQNSSVLKQRLVVFKDRTSRFLKKLRQDTLLLGVSDAQFLRTAYASPFVADQVKKTFVSDHILVVGLPAFWGDRADPNHAFIPGGAADGSDRNLLTFKPTGGSLSDLWTNPEHMMDVWINVTAHFFGGGARQILLYQGEPPVEESKYRPAEEFIFQQQHERESLSKGTKEWVANALDTRKSALGNYYIKTLVRQLRTIQAGLILSLTFRFIATNPTIEHALMGWYLFFVAGTWSYAWPWTIIGQGNNIEEQRLKANADKLLDLQIRLSQSMRLNQHQDLVNTAQELLNLYTTDSARFDALQKAIGLPPSTINLDDYSRWSRELLDYSQMMPPFATQPNTMPSWLSTWAGALSTTFLAIPLGILSLDPHYMTMSNLAFETVKAAGLYAGAYFLIGQEGVWSAVLDKFSWVSRKINDRRDLMKYSKMSCKQFQY